MNSSLVVASSVARRLRRASSTSILTGWGTAASTAVASLSTFGNASLTRSSGNDTIGSNHHANADVAAAPCAVQRRFMGSGGGTRGARGHGWWVNYRAGKGGRHLQGTYSHLDLESMEKWNDAVFQLGRQLAYLDVKVEALVDEDNDSGEDQNEQSQQQQQQVHRLTLELASEALPLATDNVVKLLQSSNLGENDGSEESPGYLSSTLHRIEKGVGILGGLVTDNPNHNPNNMNAPLTKRRMGRCHPDHRMRTSHTAMDVSSEKLVLNHLPGVITMLQPRIGEIDSRFLILSHNAPHLDGVSVAVGRLVDSLEIVQEWESSLITSHGVPTNMVLRVVGCGLLEDGDSKATASKNSSSNGTEARAQQESM
ncbi:unnamed protein product [Pseudo-nitzschia multistriata]|uniref:PPIase cyclophilin-type domain-containing protein n=1 Tax=Pseudo-nitzschia multistriata TaxID=183589 RepID=A0A448Z800_9STRA|nr:unnamed protein product [Pseudo-nitzschia multistriata]